jgi:negative regulator of flagellin synthesis FlgM
MSDIPPIKSAAPLTSTSVPRPTNGRPRPLEAPGDRLEISETGQLLSNLGGDATIRGDKVAQIRQAIADGAYESPEKIEVTVDRLLDVLRAVDATA